MLLFGKELASLKSSHSVLRVFNRGASKTLVKRPYPPKYLALHGGRKPQVDILQEVYPIFHGYAPL
jgi:hypothetical protein